MGVCTSPNYLIEVDEPQVAFEGWETRIPVGMTKLAHGAPALAVIKCCLLSSDRNIDRKFFD